MSLSTLAPDESADSARDGRAFIEWPYDEIEGLAAPDNVLRLGRRGSAALERLEILDPAFAAEIDARAVHCRPHRPLQRRQRMRVIGWSVARNSIASVGRVVRGAGDRGSADAAFAAGDRAQAGRCGQYAGARHARHAQDGAGFDCGTAPRKRPGRAALDKMLRRLETAAGLALPCAPMLCGVTRPMPWLCRADSVYVFRGLIAKAETADEVAGVIAHEIGHVAHRDGTRAVLQGAGLSFLFGMLLGDFVGGGAVVFAAKTVLQSSYSREAETRPTPMAPTS